MNNIDLLVYLLVFLSFILVTIKWFYKKYFIKKSHKWRRKSSVKALEKIKSFEHEGQIINYLRKIEPFVVEELILDALNQREDIEIFRNRRYTGDKGVDGRFNLLINENQKTSKQKCIIQVKRYSSYINIKHIMEFKEQIINENANLGIFVHTGKTSSNIKNLIQTYERIKIISGTNLIKLIKTGEF